MRVNNIQERTLQMAEQKAQHPVTVPHVVIVGAGFGGLQVARSLKEAPVSVTIIDRNNHHLFQPMLYQVATAGLSPDDIASPIRHILKEQHNAEVLMAEVTGVDVQQQSVLLPHQSINYDYLIVATGASSNYFGHDNWQKLAPGLKNVNEAMRVRDIVLLAFEAAEREKDDEKRKAFLTFVLVGGGPTGVELAGAIAELVNHAFAGDFHHIDPASARIMLVEGEARILPHFPASLSGKVHKRLQSMGVEIRTGVHVKDIDENGVSVDDQRVAAKNVIWTAGVKASPAGQWLHADVDHDGRVKVQRDLTVPGHPNLFVIGDTARAEQNGKPLPGLAPVALQEGKYVASIIAHEVVGKTRRRPFYYFNKGTLATVGRAFGVVNMGPIRFTGTLAWFVWLLVHILFLISVPNRLIVFIEYAWNFLTFQKSARNIFPEGMLPQTDEAMRGNVSREHVSRTL